jgi:hypothetical protein
MFRPAATEASPTAETPLVAGAGPGADGPYAAASIFASTVFPAATELRPEAATFVPDSLDRSQI